MSLYHSVPHRFHPRFSLLGRWIGARVRDARQAEGAYLLAVGVVLLLVVILQNLAWGWMAPLDDRDMRLGFWLVQFVGLVLFAGVCMIGFRPGFVVRTEADALVVDEAGVSTVIPIDTIERVTEIPYLMFYRHHARYTRTRAWVDRHTSRVLLIKTRENPFVLGLPEDVLEGLKAHLQERAEAMPTEEAAGVL